MLLFKSLRLYFALLSPSLLLSWQSLGENAQHPTPKWKYEVARSYANLWRSNPTISKTTDQRPISKSNTPEIVIQGGHSGTPVSLEFNADGTLAASADAQDSIKIWEVSSGRLLRTIPLLDTALAFSFSSNGQEVRTVGFDAIWIWDSASGLLTHKIPLPQELQIRHSVINSSIEEAMNHDKDDFSYITLPAAFSHDGHYVAIARMSDTISLVETATGKLKSIIRSDEGSFVRRITFSNDDTLLASATDNSVRIWESASHKERFHASMAHEFVTFMTFNPNDSIIAVGTLDESIRLWDVRKGKAVTTNGAKTGLIRSVTFDAAHLIYGSNGGIFLCQGLDMSVCEAATDEGRRFDSEVVALSASANQEFLGVGFWDGTVQFRNNYSGKPVSIGAQPLSDIVSVAATSDGTCFGVGKNDGSVAIWRSSTGQFSGSFLNTYFIEALAFTPNGRYLAAGGPADPDEQPPHSVKVWEIGSAGASEMPDVSLDTSSVAFSPDLRYLASAHASRYNNIDTPFFEREESDPLTAIVSIVDTKAREIRRLVGHQSGVLSVNFAHHSDTLVTGSKDKTVKLWDVETGKVVQSLSGHNAPVLTVAFSPDDELIASGGYDGEIKLWRRGQEDPVKTFRSCAEPKRIAFSPDGSLLAAGCAGASLWIYSFSSNQEKLFNIDSGVEEIAFVGDGSWLIYGGDDRKIHLFDLRSEHEGAVLMVYRGDSNAWTVIDSEGRFDTSDIEKTNVSWVFGDDPFRALPQEVFMRDYYQPRLLSRVLDRRELPKTAPLADLNRVQPEVKIVSVSSGVEPNTVRMDVEVSRAQGQFRRDGKNLTMVTDVYDLRVFRDGQLVRQWPEVDMDAEAKLGTIRTNAERDVWRSLHRVELDAFGRATVTFQNVRLPTASGVNKVKFTAYAFNSDRVKSRTTPAVEYVLPIPKPAVNLRRAYLITIGVNANQSHNLDLELAVPSAEQMQALLGSKLREKYSEVVEVPLFSDFAPDSNQLRLKTASKADLKAVLDMLAGRPVNPSLREEVDPKRELRAATPDDAVVLYVASHGYADPLGTFYLMPYDTGLNWGITEDLLTRCATDPNRSTICTRAEDVRRRSISSTDLAEWWSGLDAGEMVMILDSCHSGAVSGNEFKPGPLGDPGFGQLSYDKGMQILSASQPAQTEKGEWVTAGEGRTLLVEALEVVAAANPKQTLQQWLQGAEHQIPLIAKKLFPELSNEDVQTPILLDFSKRTTAD